MITYEIDTHRTIAAATPRKLPKILKKNLTTEQREIICDKLDKENYQNHTMMYYHFLNSAFFRKLSFYIKTFKDFSIVLANQEGEWEIIPSKLYFSSPIFYNDDYNKIWHLSWHTTMSGKYKIHETETIFSLTELISNIEDKENEEI